MQQNHCFISLLKRLGSSKTSHAWETSTSMLCHFMQQTMVLGLDLININAIHLCNLHSLDPTYTGKYNLCHGQLMLESIGLLCITLHCRVTDSWIWKKPMRLCSWSVGLLLFLKTGSRSWRICKEWSDLGGYSRMRAESCLGLLSASSLGSIAYCCDRSLARKWVHCFEWKPVYGAMMQSRWRLKTMLSTDWRELNCIWSNIQNTYIKKDGGESSGGNPCHPCVLLREGITLPGVPAHQIHLEIMLCSCVLQREPHAKNIPCLIALKSLHVQCSSLQAGIALSFQ